MTNIQFDSSLGFDSPIGPITVRALGDQISQVVIGENTSQGLPSKAITRAKKQILRMLDGKSSDENLSYILNGTPFQMAVWKAIAKIPYGSSVTYRDLATAAGNPKAVRAAGAAVGANPIPLLIPCHRVLGSSQKITGYSGGDGLPTKRKLLAIEKISFRE